jgi:hypothetical protein
MIDFQKGWQKSVFKINKWVFHELPNAMVWAAKNSDGWTAHLWEHGTATNDLYFGTGQTRKMAAKRAYANWLASKR